MTTALRTVFDCGRWLRLVEATVVADAHSHAGLVAIDELNAYLEMHRGLRGVVKLRRVIELMEPKTESPMETRLRLLLVLAGLPRPEVQVVIRDDHDGFVARADFGYPEQRLVIEYDGAHHWNQRRADDHRRDAMRSLGWEVLVVSAEDYYETPDLTIARIRAALLKRTTSLSRSRGRGPGRRRGPRRRTDGRRPPGVQQAAELGRVRRR
jgi:hypothetical protein